MQRLRVFANRGLRKIFGPKREGVSDGSLEKGNNIREYEMGG
jgi:hypothetical protein